MKNYTENFRTTYKDVIEENKKENKKRFKKILYRNILWGLVIISFILISLGSKRMSSLIPFEESLLHVCKSFFENWESTTGIILFVAFTGLLAYLFALSTKTEEVSEKLKKSAETFVNDCIRKDILNIMYSNFPPFIQSNKENRIDNAEFLAGLTPRVSVDHTGNLSIYTINLDYRDKNTSLNYEKEKSTYYLKKIEWQSMYGIFKLEFDKVNEDRKVEKMDAIEFTPED